MKSIKDLQKAVEGLIVQLDLGRMEAMDKVEQAKEHLLTLAQRIEQSGEAVAKPLRQSLGDLELQLKLGKMEGRDAYYEQRSKIEDSLRKAEESFRENQHEAKEEFIDAAHHLMNRIHLLGLQVEETEKNAGKDLASVRAGVKKELNHLADKLREEVNTLDEKARSSADQCRSALAGISSNLKTLFKHK